jgi:hypothetical protein
MRNLCAVTVMCWGIAACGGDSPARDTDVEEDAASVDAGDVSLDTAEPLDSAPSDSTDEDSGDAGDGEEAGGLVDVPLGDDVADVGPPSALRVVSPNGAERWAISQPVTIRWSGGDTRPVRILLSLDDGYTWSQVLAEQAPNTGSFVVERVDEWMSRAARVRVEVADAPEVGDASDRSFHIPPTLGILWEWNTALRSECDGLGRDEDGDGLFTSDDESVCHDVEAWLGTDPAHRDTDRDAISDYIEVFGDGVFSYYDPIPDRDGDGLIAPLDVDDDGDGIHDGLALDSDGDGIANFLEFYGYVYDALADRFFAWDGDVSVPYFKSDPLQPSTDQDPYTDAMEVTGVLMDPSVIRPGNHPMVPAYPNILVTLERYDVTLDATVTYTDGTSDSVGTNWSSNVTSSASLTDEFSWELGVEVGASVGILDSSVSGSVSATVGGRTSTTYTNAVGRSEGGDRVTSAQWSEATSSNPSETARVSLYLKVRNLGTSTASAIRPTFTLRIGDRNVTTFTPGGPLVDLLQPGGVYPSVSDTYWVVDTRQATGGGPIHLSLEELRALEGGAPVVLDVTQLDATVYRQQVGGVWELIGSWNQYMARIVAVSAHIVLDGGEGRIYDAMVYANDTPTSPEVTLRDALIWIAGAYDDPALGLAIRYPNDVGTLVPQSLDRWFYNFDGATFERLAALREDPDFNLLDLRLGPSSVVVAKAPPSEPQPVIYWVAPRLQNDQVYAWVVDAFHRSEDITVELHVAGDEPRVVPMAYNPSLGVFVANVGPTYTIHPEDRVLARSPFFAVAEEPEFWETEAPVPGYVEAWTGGTLQVPDGTNGLGGGCVGSWLVDLVHGEWARCGGRARADGFMISDSYACPHCTQSLTIQESSFAGGHPLPFCIPAEPMAWGRMRLVDARRCSTWTARLGATTPTGAGHNFDGFDASGLAFFMRLPDEDGAFRLAKVRILQHTGRGTTGYRFLFEYEVWDSFVD